jgi:hypothetical protein
VATTVDNGNFVRAETDRMFRDLQVGAGGINRWHHSRVPTPLDEQHVIRMNRDTLYSMAVVDISQGATVTVPESGERYLSVMVVNQDHYINRIFHEAGTYDLTIDELDTPYVLLAARVLADPADPDDVARANAVQDGFGLTAASSQPFEMPDFDEASFTATRQALLAEAAKGFAGTHGMFGSKEETDPDVHRIGTAVGWGGLPEREAFYVGADPGLPVGAYQLTFEDVPVDAFWSITVYNRDGFLEENDLGVYSINSLTGAPNDDGSITVHLGGDRDQPNCIPLPEGWNYTIRLYRPRAEVLDGSWTVPAIQPADPG